ncbi:MAG: hypothetical protein ABI321_12255 [Polyangia bacterium]
MTPSRALVCAALVLLTASGAGAQESIFTNVASAFKPGPYSFLKVDATDPQRFVVGQPDGTVLETRDGGSTVYEASVIQARQYYPMVLRGLGGARPPALSRTFGRTAHRLFISLLQSGTPTTRWASWMSLEDPSTEILDVALPLPGGHGALAGPNGVYISDERMGVWTRALGTPRPKGNVLMGFSVAFDPGNPNVLFCGTSEGLLVSYNGGTTFSNHPDRKLADERVNQILWDAADPKNVFLIAGGTIYKSENRGQSFESVLSLEQAINAMATAEEGVYVAFGKGLSLFGSEGTKELIKDENVVGVVSMGAGSVLAATETQLWLIDADGKRSLMNTTAQDPFVKLAGAPEVSWALTKFGIYRIGVKEPREHQRAKKGPRLLMTLDEVQAGALAFLGISNPTRTRLNDRWYANLLPMLIVEVKQQLSPSNTVTYDGTFPIRYRFAQATNSITCCGGYNTNEPQALVMVKWDLAKIIAGAYGNVTMPFGMVEQGLRTNRTKVLDEVRWRYREIRQLCAQLRFPPKDPKTRLFWQLRLEEYAHYIDALTGKKVVAIEDDLENLDDSQSN